MSYAIKQQEWQCLPEHAQREVYDFFLFIKARYAKGNDSVEPVDLSELTFERITQDQRELVFTPPLILEPTLDESEQLFVITDDSLNLNVYAQTREQLAEDLESELFFLWDEYAKEDSQNLTPKANRLKQELLRRCKEN
jgi:hypothetical protein